MSCRLVLLSMAGILCISPVYTSRILLLPAQQVSLVMEQVVVGEVLVERGHQVYVLLDSTYPKVTSVKQAGINPIFYEEPEGVETFVTLLDKLAASVFDQTVQPDESRFMQVSMGICERILRNTALMNQLRSMDFDLIVTNGFDLQPCLFIISHNLTVPYVYQFSSAPEIFIGIPSLPSFVISEYTSDFAPPLSFVEKLKTIVQILFVGQVYADATDFNMLAEFAPGTSSIWGLIRKSELFIITRDHLLEWPVPRLPNTIYLPGITGKEAKPLPANINTIMDGSKDVALLSFGSAVEDMPENYLMRLAEGMGKVKHVTFLFRVSKKAEQLAEKFPDNVKPMGWLPQNDVLAHPNTKLFITHCGNNGQYEAVYHGVPMIGFPLFADQFHNCMRMEKHELGLCMDIHDFSPEVLASNIHAVLGSELFNKNANKLSRIMKKQPFPSETAASWIEHVLEFGGEHLRSASQDMPVYEFLMFDIIGAVFACCIVILCVLICFVKTVCRVCCNSGYKIKVE